MLTADQIAKATGCPAANVAANWPRLLKALEAAGHASDLEQIAVAATVATETPFVPVAERRASQVRQPSLYASQGRYWPWHGRGFVQLTWEDNYRLYSKLLGVDLISLPELAMEPWHAARILVEFFDQHYVFEASERQDWRAVRKLVNGGYNGWDRFEPIVRKLLGCLDA
jgi:hypothetical protein